MSTVLRKYTIFSVCTYIIVFSIVLGSLLYHYHPVSTYDGFVSRFHPLEVIRRALMCFDLYSNACLYVFVVSGLSFCLGSQRTHTHAHTTVGIHVVHVPRIPTLAVRWRIRPTAVALVRREGTGSTGNSRVRVSCLRRPPSPSLSVRAY